MKIIDETGIVLTTEPDLEAGYLVEDVEVVHHDAVEGTAPQWHRETAKLPDGSLAIYYRDGKEIGRDMVKVIDVPGVDPQPAWDEEVPVMRYILYTADELAAQAEAKKKAEEAAAAEAKKKAELETVPGRMDALEVKTMKTLNNLKLRIMVRAFRIRLNNGEAFEAIAADYPALTADDLEAIHVQLTEKEAQSNG